MLPIDVDDDGDVDLAGGEGTHRNDGRGVFGPLGQGAGLGGAPVSAGTAAVADVDADGDADVSSAPSPTARRGCT